MWNNLWWKIKELTGWAPHSTHLSVPACEWTSQPSTRHRRRDHPRSRSCQKCMDAKTRIKDWACFISHLLSERTKGWGMDLFSTIKSQCSRMRCSVRATLSRRKVGSPWESQTWMTERPEGSMRHIDRLRLAIIAIFRQVHSKTRLQTNQTRACTKQGALCIKTVTQMVSETTLSHRKGCE